MDWSHASRAASLGKWGQNEDEEELDERDASSLAVLEGGGGMPTERGGASVAESIG